MLNELFNQLKANKTALLVIAVVVILALFMLARKGTSAPTAATVSQP